MYFIYVCMYVVYVMYVMYVMYVCINVCIYVFSTDESITRDRIFRRDEDEVSII